jgi:hypothetical protein
MTYALIGLAVVVVTALALWQLLPRGGTPHRLAKTVWAPYLSIAIEGSLAFGLALIFSGLTEL